MKILTTILIEYFDIKKIPKIRSIINRSMGLFRLLRYDQPLQTCFWSIMKTHG